MNSISISECRKHLGSALHKILMAGKHGALVILYSKLFSSLFNANLHAFQAVKSLPPLAFTSFCNLSLSQKVMVLSAGIGG